MTVLNNLNSNEKQAIQELKIRLKSMLTPGMRDDKTLFYRFLKARDFDIEKADVFLRKHIAWRKSFQVDNICQTFQPNEYFAKYNGLSFIGFDKEANIVNYAACGKIDAREILHVIKLNDMMKHHIWMAEKNLLLMKRENKKTGKNAFQGVYIFDLDQLTFSNLTSRAAADTYLQILSVLQDNYPEYMKSVYIINAPAYYIILFSVLKRIMSNAMIQKVQAFGRTGWKDVLLKGIDADVLPAFLGGNRTDPDGNPLCSTFIFHGGPVPTKYFLSPEERTFQDKTRVRKIQIIHGSSFKVPVDVRECGSVIQWEFEVKNKDVGFGLFVLKESENGLEEVLPIQRFVTRDGTENGSYQTLSVGTYVIVFDNSHSWISSKEVYYCITLQISH